MATATLQPVTTEAAARALNVGVRSVYKAKIVARDPELQSAVIAGRMSLHEAFLAATGKSRPNGLDRLRAAWRAADADEKAEFLAEMMELVDSTSDLAGEAAVGPGSRI